MITAEPKFSEDEQNENIVLEGGENDGGSEDLNKIFKSSEVGLEKESGLHEDGDETTCEGQSDPLASVTASEQAIDTSPCILHTIKMMKKEKRRKVIGGFFSSFLLSCKEYC